MKAIILAGGFGNRLKDINKDIPKPMTKICGKPVLEHQLEVLKREGIVDFIFVVGYLGYKIEEYFGDGSGFDVNISYYYENEPLGTAGALFEIMPEEDFLLCNGDLIFDFDVKKIWNFHRENEALATLFSHPNSHPYDSTLIVADENGLVSDFLVGKDKPKTYQNLSNAGIMIISPELLNLHSIKGKADLDRDIIMKSVGTKRIFTYKSTEYVHDMGTPERLKSVENDIKEGIVQKYHSRYLQKAIFLDRDGTINKHKGFIVHPDDIELIDGVAEAINNFHKLGYLVIVITNQPVIARGDCTEQTLKEIHNRLEMLLGKEGAYLDGIYYCPHHPDKGFDGEVEELKKACNCRKPAPGLILKACDDFNIDLSASYMVGDSRADVEAGKNAGCTPIYIGEDVYGFCDSFGSLREFSEYRLR